MHALVSVAREMKSPAGSDEAIRTGLLTELDKEIWTPVSQINVVVRNGIVELWGVIADERHREALKVLAENIPGVRAARDHLAWMEPLSGTVINPPGDQAKVAMLVARSHSAYRARRGVLLQSRLDTAAWAPLSPAAKVGV